MRLMDKIDKLSDDLEDEEQEEQIMIGHSIPNTHQKDTKKGRFNGTTETKESTGDAKVPVLKMSGLKASNTMPSVPINS